MVINTDVLVVGGGATGAGVARDLALRDVDVTLVERGQLGSGTTGHSHGLLHSGARYAVDDPASAIECSEENQILRDIAPDCISPTGGYFVQFSGDSTEYFEEKATACEECNIPVERLSGTDAIDDAPYLAEDVERALRVPDAVVDPVRLTVANAVDARQRGAQIRTQTTVTDLVTDGDRVVGAELRDADGETETIHANHVVNACGAWAGELAQHADIGLEMRPTKGALVVVDYPPLDAVVNRCRHTADGDIVVPFGDTAIVGTTSVEVDDPDEFPEEDWEVDLLREEGARMLPDLADADIAQSYWGVRPLYEPPTDDRPADARSVTRNFFLLDHADRDDVAGFTTIVGGKVTTYRRMAEATADRVCETLGVDEPCETATTQLTDVTDTPDLEAYAAATTLN